MSIVPAKTLPSTITLPEKFTIAGRLKGGMNAMAADLKTTFNFG